MSLVSIIIPSYNRAHTLERAVLSVINQSYKNVEIVVIDDGSTDNTREVADRLCSEYPNVHYHYKENGGAASALNHGIRNSKGDLIGWLSSDDWYDMKNNKLIELAVDAHKDPKVGMTYSDYSVINSAVNYAFDAFYSPDKKECVNKLLANCYINGSSTIMKRDVFYTVGLYDEFFKYAQDYDFYFRVLTLFDIKKVSNDNGTLLNYYYDDANVHVCLGNKITNGEHDNEAAPVIERYRLAFNKTKTVCAMLCVRNESEHIDACINDLSMYVDSIVVIDDGSIDNTVALVSKWKKVKRFKQKPVKRFGEQRTEGVDRQELLNMSYELGSDFSFFIDADEIAENRMKTEIYKMTGNDQVSLWFFHEENFWRSERFTRKDNQFDWGWFGRLFRMTPGLTYDTHGEHCGGIPSNIPDTCMWIKDQPTQGRSQIRIKHYGFSSEEKILKKVRALWARERGRLNKTERLNMYARLLDEATLELAEYVEQPYWLKARMQPTTTNAPVKKSEALQAELRMMLSGVGLYSDNNLIFEMEKRKAEAFYIGSVTRNVKS